MTAPRPLPRAPADAHILVVGAGGLGCPATWGLVEAGVGRITVVDLDVVDLSNLPRQVLYGPSDVGAPKAPTAVTRFVRDGVDLRGVAARLDETTEDDLLDGVDLVLDATDGARVKDWINAMAARRGVPLVHAGVLRGEGRLLDVPAGGRPCLACLFGRLERDQGTCAELGIWGTAVGAVGFLASRLAIERLAAPDAPSRGYTVLDLDGDRAITLAAAASPDCPVCGDGAAETRSGPEHYPPMTASEPDLTGLVTDALPADRIDRFARVVVLGEVGPEGLSRLFDAHVVLVGEGVALATAAVYLAASGIERLSIHDGGRVDDAVGRFPFDEAAPGDRRDEAIARRIDPRSVGSVRAVAARPDRLPDADLVARVVAEPISWIAADVTASGAQAQATLLADAVCRRVALPAPPPPSEIRVRADGAGVVQAEPHGGGSP